MRKLILSVFVLALAAPTYAQMGAGATPTSPDPNTSPGAGFGGALGGANSTNAPTNVPSNTLPRSDTLNSPGTIQADQTRIQEQQRMEDPTNPMGGSQSGLDNPTTTPTTTPTSPESGIPRGTSPSPRVVPSATGVGTGAPTSY